MIFNIYNFKLYSPNGDAEYSGGGAEGGRGEGESPAGEPTSGTTGGTSSSGSTSSEPREDVKKYDTSINYFKQTVDKSKSSLTKAIETFGFSKKNNNRLKARGEKRQIIVKGTPGATFTLTVEDSSGCSLLKDKLENIKIPTRGKYVLEQEFPSIMSKGSAVKTEEIYTAEIQPAADVAIAMPNRTISLRQTADPVITITNTTSQTSPALSVSGSDITLTGKAFSFNNDTTKTYRLTITESGESTGGKLYVSNLDSMDNFTTNTKIIKRIDREGGEGSINTLCLKNISGRTTSTIEGESETTHDLLPGMRMYAKVLEQKRVIGNLDKDGEIIDYDTCDTLPEKIKLDTTNDLFLGMVIYGDVVAGTYIKSIDCNQTVTIHPRQKVRVNSNLIFQREYYNSVGSILDSSDGSTTKITTPKLSNIPDGTEIEFDDNRNTILSKTYSSKTSTAGSGTDTIILTNIIKPTRFGDKNVTFTLDLDQLVTSKPNAYNITTTIKRNTATAINMIQHDRDANASSKTGTIVENPKNGTVSSYATSTDSFTYTPNEGFTGEDSFTFTMSDGTNSSDEKTVIIKVI
jgi:hypothetical protein